jgi:hypothetical protein
MNLKLFAKLAMFCLGGIFLFAGIDNRPPSGAAPLAFQGEVLPAKAYVVFTKESWGCLEGQEIKADLAQPLTTAPGEPVLLREVKNPEDVDNRFELYVYFPASGIRGLPGYYVLRLGVVGRQPQAAGTLCLARAVLDRGDQGLIFTLQAQIEGALKADLLYAGSMRLESGLFTCPAADLFEPQPVRFLPVYPVHPEMASTAMESTPPWVKIVIPLEDYWLQEGDEVAACLVLLSALDHDFSFSKDHSFLWDRARVTSENLHRIAASLEKERGLKFYVKIELRDQGGTTEIIREPAPFLPRLSQMIAITDTGGKMIGGNVMIGIEKVENK